MTLDANALKSVLSRHQEFVARDGKPTELDIWISPQGRMDSIQPGNLVSLFLKAEEPASLRNLQWLNNQAEDLKEYAARPFVERDLIRRGFVKLEAREGRNKALEVSITSTNTASSLQPIVDEIRQGYPHIQLSFASSQMASVQKEAEEIQASEKNAVAGQSTENRYNEALAQCVRAKSEQIDRLEDRLLGLIGLTEASLAVGANSGPGFLGSAEARTKWEAQRQRQMQRLEHLEERLERVHEIREESGLFATKVEELAEEKLRREEPELARERDAALERHRYEKANERVLNNEAQHELGEELERSLSES